MRKLDYREKKLDIRYEPCDLFIKDANFEMILVDIDSNVNSNKTLI
jgi:hypothetical protein